MKKSWDWKTDELPFPLRGLAKFSGVKSLWKNCQGVILFLGRGDLFWARLFFHLDQLGVSKNSGTPKSSILTGFSIIFTIHFGYPYFWKHLIGGWKISTHPDPTGWHSHTVLVPHVATVTCRCRAMMKPTNPWRAAKRSSSGNCSGEKIITCS